MRFFRTVFRLPFNCVIIRFHDDVGIKEFSDHDQAQATRHIFRNILGLCSFPDGLIRTRLLIFETPLYPGDSWMQTWATYYKRSWRTVFSIHPGRLEPLWVVNLQEELGRLLCRVTPQSTIPKVKEPWVIYTPATRSRTPAPVREADWTDSFELVLINLVCVALIFVILDVLLCGELRRLFVKVEA